MDYIKSGYRRLAIRCVAVDKLSVLGGPITSDGSFLAMWATRVHNLIYTIEGCEDYVGIYVKEINGWF